MNFTFENNIIKTEERKFDYFMGIGEAYYEAMSRKLGKMAQLDDKTMNSDTYQTLLAKCVRTAIELKKRNIKKGDVVTVCCFNHLNTCVPIIASYFIGAVPFVVNIAYPPNVWETLVDLQPKIFFADKASEAAILDFLKTTPAVQADLVVFDTPSFKDAFLKPKPEEEAEFKPVHIEDLSETAAIYFSSGTTAGIPKLILIEHYNMTKMLFKTPANREASVRTSNLAWCWIGSYVYLSSAVSNGDCRILVDDFYGVPKNKIDIKQLFRVIEEYRISEITINPLLARALFEVEKTDRDVSKLERISAGGSPMFEEYYVKVTQLFPNALPLNWYGATEFGAPVAFNLENEEHRKLHAEKMHSVGVPLSGYWIKIVDPETEKTLGPNEIGEMRLKSKYLISKGYRDREEWAKCFDSEGWFKTGDLMYYDEKFRFFIKDRLKFIINSKGTRFYPIEIESLLIQHPAIKEVAVVGLPSKESELVQLPTAAVILKDGFKVTAEEIVKFFKEHPQNTELNKHALTGGVRFVKSFPMNNGKVMKLKLKEMLIEKDKSWATYFGRVFQL